METMEPSASIVQSNESNDAPMRDGNNFDYTMWEMSSAEILAPIVNQTAAELVERINSIEPIKESNSTEQAPIQQQLTSLDPQFKCVQIGCFSASFPSKDALIAHCQEKHNTQPKIDVQFKANNHLIGSQEAYRCGWNGCEQTFTTLGLLCVHQRTEKHLISPSSSQEHNGFNGIKLTLKGDPNPSVMLRTKPINRAEEPKLDVQLSTPIRTQPNSVKPVASTSTVQPDSPIEVLPQPIKAQSFGGRRLLPDNMRILHMEPNNPPVPTMMAQSSPMGIPSNSIMIQVNPIAIPSNMMQPNSTMTSNPQLIVQPNPLATSNPQLVTQSNQLVTPILAQQNTPFPFMVQQQLPPNTIIVQQSPTTSQQSQIPLEFLNSIVLQQQQQNQFNLNQPNSILVQQPNQIMLQPQPNSSQFLIQPYPMLNQQSPLMHLQSAPIQVQPNPTYITTQQPTNIVTYQLVQAGNQLMIQPVNVPSTSTVHQTYPSGFNQSIITVQQSPQQPTLSNIQLQPVVPNGTQQQLTTTIERAESPTEDPVVQQKVQDETDDTDDDNYDADTIADDATGSDNEVVPPANVHTCNVMEPSDSTVGQPNDEYNQKPSSSSPAAASSSSSSLPLLSPFASTSSSVVLLKPSKSPMTSGHHSHSLHRQNPHNQSSSSSSTRPRTPPNVLKCNFARCSSVFNSMPSLVRHCRNIHYGTFRCRRCDKPFAHRLYLNRHHARHMAAPFLDGEPMSLRRFLSYRVVERPPPSRSPSPEPQLFQCTYPGCGGFESEMEYEVLQHVESEHMRKQQPSASTLPVTRSRGKKIAIIDRKSLRSSATDKPSGSLSNKTAKDYVESV